MTSTPVLSLYIYYRLRADLDVDIAHASVREMQAVLEQTTCIAGRLLQRADDASTWMEIYEGVTQYTAFMHALESETAAHQLADLLDSGSVRHLECFMEKR